MREIIRTAWFTSKDPSIKSRNVTYGVVVYMQDEMVFVKSGFVKGKDIDEDVDMICSQGMPLYEWAAFYVFGSNYKEAQKLSDTAPYHPSSFTSAEGARKIQPRLKNLYGRIIKQLNAYRYEGLTARNLCNMLGVQWNTITPRITELKRAGYITVIGEVIDDETKTMVSLYSTTSLSNELVIE
jgi:hypothetical protein